MSWSNKMNYKIKLSIFTITAALISFSCGKNDNKEEEKHQHEESHELVTLLMNSINEIGLKTEIVSLKSLSGYLKIPAKVITDQDNEAIVGSLVQGRTHKVLVKAGDYVKAGQILMYVEGLEIGEIKAAYLKAKANLDFMEADLERHKTLSDQNIGSRQSYYEAKAEYEKALAENYSALMDAIAKAKPSAAKGKYIKAIYVSTTMGPSMKIDTNKSIDSEMAEVA